jgi:hypothetical protein
MPSSYQFGRPTNKHLVPISLLIIVLTFRTFSTLTPPVADFYSFRAPATDLVTRVPRTASAPLLRLYASRSSPTSSSNPENLEQLGISFTQDFQSLAYKVTAVQQTGADGYGPAYLLNCLSDRGYWYQVGFSWNWGGSFATSGYTPGFNFNYEVFDPSGNSIFPAGGGGGLSPFSRSVNQGDTVLLSLYFSSNGQVEMLALDQNTEAQAGETYSAKGATYFVGTLLTPANSQGFFTGLMTEWYHTDQYYGNEQKVVYSAYGFSISSAWMWIDEFNAQNKSQMLFFDQTSSPVSYSNPTQMQKFSSHGATEYSDAYQFITGSLSTVALTLSYAVQDGGTGYFAPSLTYTFDEVQQTATLTTSPATYYVDLGSFWTVTNPLPNSSSTERWQADQQTNGTASSSQTINMVYSHQYYVIVQPNPSDSGFTSPDSNWFDADTSLQIAAFPNTGWQFEGWSGFGKCSYSGQMSAGSINVTSAVTEIANFYPGLTVQTSSETSVSYRYGSTTGLIPPSTFQTVYAPPGTSITLAANPSSFIYAFGGWTGAVTDSTSTISVILNTPLSLSASHSYNYVNIGLMTAGTMSAAVILIAAAMRRRARPTQHEESG